MINGYFSTGFRRRKKIIFFVGEISSRLLSVIRKTFIINTEAIDGFMYSVVSVSHGVRKANAFASMLEEKLSVILSRRRTRVILNQFSLS